MGVQTHFSEKKLNFSGKAAPRITAIFWRTHFSATAAKNDPLGWERKRRHPVQKFFEHKSRSKNFCYFTGKKLF